MKDSMTIRCPVCGDIIDVPVELKSIEIGEKPMRGDEQFVEVKWYDQMIVHEHLKHP
jgi:hypothetical protein